MMDLWTLFVENIFGGFALTIIGFVMILGLILMMGSVSIVSVIFFMITFLLAMTFGYGEPLITIGCVVVILVWWVMQFQGFLDRGGGQ